jgi:hypothetical protein
VIYSYLDHVVAQGRTSDPGGLQAGASPNKSSTPLQSSLSTAHRKRGLQGPAHAAPAAHSDREALGSQSPDSPPLLSGRSPDRLPRRSAPPFFSSSVVARRRPYVLPVVSSLILRRVPSADLASSSGSPCWGAGRTDPEIPPPLGARRCPVLPLPAGRGGCHPVRQGCWCPSLDRQHNADAECRSRTQPASPSPACCTVS